MSLNMSTYMEEFLNVLQQIQATIGEICLLRNFDIVTRYIIPSEHMICVSHKLGTVFAC